MKNDNSFHEANNMRTLSIDIIDNQCKVDFHIDNNQDIFPFLESLFRWAKDIKKINLKLYFDLKLLTIEKIIKIFEKLSFFGEVDLHLLNLKEFPIELFEFPNFTISSLAMERCESEIPETIFWLKNLRSLSLKNKKIKSLPSAISNLTELEILDISDNLLEDLPDALSQLTKLRKLNLNNNQFQKLPECIYKLDNLESLYIKLNHLTETSDASIRYFLGKLYTILPHLRKVDFI